MPISIIFSFLTYPKKNRPDETLVSGTAITPDDRKRNNMRGDLSDAAGSESNIPVMFTSDNAQANPVRTELLALLKNPGVESAATGKSTMDPNRWRTIGSPTS